MENLSAVQLSTLRAVFDAEARSAADSTEATLDALALMRILAACGITSTEAEAQGLILRADVSGRGRLNEADFLQLMASALADSDPSAEVDALFDELVATTAPEAPAFCSSDSVGAACATAENVLAFLERARAEEGIEPSAVPRMTREEVAALCADIAVTAPAEQPSAVSRADFQRFMELSLEMPAGHAR